MTAPNPLRPRGPLRPVPQHVVASTWKYRGRVVDITDVGPPYSNKPGWWAKISFSPDDEGRAFRHLLDVTSADLGDGFFLGPAPDPHAMMHHAVHYTDAQHAIAAAARAHGQRFDETDLNRGLMAARMVVGALQASGKPITRATITRGIETMLQGTRAAPNRSAVPDSTEAILGEAFMRLPLEDRIEIADEIVAVAQSYGGRWPNPKPDAHLLELHVTLLERQLAQLVDECRRLANPSAADEVAQARADLAECHGVLERVRALIGDQEGWRTVPPEAVLRLTDPEALARYAASWSEEREREAMLQLRNVHVMAPHERLVWQDFRVGLVADGESPRLQVRFKPKTTGAPYAPIRAKRKALTRALDAVREGEFAEDALRDQGVDLAGVFEATIIAYEDEVGHDQVRAFGLTG